MAGESNKEQAARNDLFRREEVSPFWNAAPLDDRELIVGWQLAQLLDRIKSANRNIPGIFSEHKWEPDLLEIASKYVQSRLSDPYIRDPRNGGGLPVEEGKMVARIQEQGYGIAHIAPVGRFTDTPPVHFYHAYCDQMVGTGVGMNRDSAIKAAIGEALERRVFRFPKAPWIRRLKAGKGEACAIDAKSWWLVTAPDGSPPPEFSRLEEVICRWVRGIDWFSRKPVLLPAQLVFWGRRYEGDNIRLFPVTTNGCACGHSLEDGVRRAVLELVERDAFMVSWLRMVKPAHISAESLRRGARSAHLRKLLADLDRYRLAYHVLALPTDLPVHAIAAVLCDPSGIGPAVAVGARADFDFETAATAALLESLATYIIWRGKPIASPLAETGSSLPPAYGFPMGLRKRLEVWAYGKDARGAISWFLDGPRQGLDEAGRFFGEEEEAFSSLLDALRNKGCHLFVYTPPESGLNHLGFWPVRAIIPELAPVYLQETEAPLHHPRFQTLPEALGLHLPRDAWNPLPHPFP